MRLGRRGVGEYKGNAGGEGRSITKNPSSPRTLAHAGIIPRQDAAERGSAIAAAQVSKAKFQDVAEG